MYKPSAPSPHFERLPFFFSPGDRHLAPRSRQVKPRPERPREQQLDRVEELRLDRRSFQRDAGSASISSRRAEADP